MTTQDILELDFRDEKSHIIMQKALKLIGPFEKINGDIPLEKMEKLISLMKRKYDVDVPMILSSSSDGYYSMVINVNRGKAKYVYGLTMYELFSKASVLLWSLSRKNKLNKRYK